jgi:hypothetical protein
MKDDAWEETLITTAGGGMGKCAECYREVHRYLWANHAFAPLWLRCVCISRALCIGLYCGSRRDSDMASGDKIFFYYRALTGFMFLICLPALKVPIMSGDLEPDERNANK